MKLPWKAWNEVKCVRGPSGRGASRAEEKGARRCSGLIASFGPRVTKHESRITAFVAVVFAVGAQGTHNQNPPHGPPLLPPDRRFPARCGAAWGGMGGRRPPCRQHGLLGFHQPRITQHVFPLPSGGFKESNPNPGQRVFTKHESRVTKHGFLVFHESRITAFCALV